MFGWFKKKEKVEEPVVFYIDWDKFKTVEDVVEFLKGAYPLVSVTTNDEFYKKNKHLLKGTL